MSRRTMIVIPARMDAKRLPGKPMLMAAGKPLVHHTYERAKKCKLADHVFVVTPDREIADYCQKNGMGWRPSNSELPTGTHRVADFCAQLAPQRKPYAVVNWQVDEPLVEPAHVDALIAGVLNESHIDVTTLLGEVADEERTKFEIDQSRVKCRVNTKGVAQTFTRMPLPLAYEHIGVYAFKYSALMDEIANQPAGHLSPAEGLEQLAWLDIPLEIHACVVPEAPLGINYQTDFDHFKRIMESGS